MIKGWKNNPKWVEYYENKEAKRRKETLERINQDIILKRIMAKAQAGFKLQEELRNRSC